MDKDLFNSVSQSDIVVSKDNVNYVVFDKKPDSILLKSNSDVQVYTRQDFNNFFINSTEVEI